MNIALSFLSEAAEQSVIDRLQSYAATDSQSIAEQQLADPDYWSSVGIIALTGILVVFLILAILIAFFYLIGVIFKAIDKKKAAKAAETAAIEQKAAPAAAPVAEEAEVEEADDEDEVMAVIAAAVAAYGAAEGKSYSIRDVKKRGDGRTRSAWSLAGIHDNTRPF